MGGDDMAAVDAIGTAVQMLSSATGGAILLAVAQAIIARFTNRQKEARERAEAEEAEHDRRVERESRRADRAERALKHHRARADRMHGNWIAVLDAFSILRRQAIDAKVPDSQLEQAPTPLPITDEEKETAP